MSDFFSDVGNKPSPNLRDYIWTIYGPPGIGKTTFASEGDYLIVAFEGGYTAMEASAVDLTLDKHPNPKADPKAAAEWKDADPWSRFLITIGEISALDAPPWAGVCIDTLDAAYLAAMGHVLAAKGWAHVDDGGQYGKGYDAVNTPFKGAIMRLVRLGIGLAFVSHSKDREFKGRGGVSYQKVVPSVTPSMGKWIIGLSDLVLFADAVPGAGGKPTRVVHTQPSYRFDAKARGRRSTPLPSPLHLDYASFSRAFSQTMRGHEVDAEDLPVVSEIQAVPQTVQVEKASPWPSK